MSPVRVTRKESGRSMTSPRQRKSWRSLWRRRLSSVPNQITALRLLMIPPLWLLAILRDPVALGTLLAVAALTDVLDGYVARSRKLASKFGSRFDSVADHLLTVSTVAWLLLLRPELFREQWLPIAVWLALGLPTLAIGWLRFQRIGGAHLYSAKAAGFLGYGFAIYLLLLGSYPEPLFYLVIGVAYLAVLETLIVQLTGSEAHETIGSILQRRRRAGRDEHHPPQG
jgi:phosphatidylglycerophosphate synthase